MTALRPLPPLPPDPRRRPPGEATGDFLRAVFAGLPGVVEFRCVPDQRSGPRGGAASFWFDDVEAATRAVDEIRTFAEARGLTVSLGLLPRRKRSGKAVDTLPGRVVWADVDFKTLEEKEARRRIAALGPLQPAVTVHSGHGLHLYWLLDEEADPAMTTSLCRRVGHLLGADACHDAARVLRLPGSLNLKECWSGGAYRFDAAKARPCRIESADYSRRLAVGDFAGLPEPPLSASARARLNRVNRTISDVPDEVRGLIASDARLSALWDSRGKTGRDTSNSGYDASFALALARKGVVDPDILDAAVAARPVVGDTSARCHRAVRRTVDWATSRVAAERAAGAIVPTQDDWFMRFVEEVLGGKRTAKDLSRILVAAPRFVQTPQRQRLALLLGGWIQQGCVKGVPCPKCGSASVEWTVPPSTSQARCAACGARRLLARLCEESGIDILATLGPLMAED